MWTVETITKYCKDLATTLGHNFNIPVKINGRLTRTLGMVRYNTCCGKDHPYVMEFSKHYIENATDDCVEQTILHEFAHWLTAIETDICHGHDEVFREACNRIGCNHDKATAQVEKLVADKPFYRYSVLCDNCGEIAGYSRMNKTLKNIDFCSCGKCGNKHITYKKNW